MADFSEWVKEMGGDDDFLSILKQFGFSSKLSLSHLNFSDEKELSDRLNAGQRCLLKGLIDLAQEHHHTQKSENPYVSGLQKISDIKSKTGASSGHNMKARIGKLFNFKNDDDADFLPMKRKRLPSGKQPANFKKPPKKKLKEIRLQVVGMTHPPSSIPVGSERDQMQRVMWLPDNANEEQVKQKIKDEFGWDDSCDVKYMYACGRHIRPATLQDVQNADTWDCETIRVLMASGRLYVVKVDNVTHKSKWESEEVHCTYMCLYCITVQTM